MATIQLKELGGNLEMSEQEQALISGGSDLLLTASTTDGTAAAKDHKNWINVASCNMGGHR